MDIRTQLSNIIWHIEVNRDALGDKRTLDDVLVSLKRMEYDEGLKKAASKS
ncbi:hypothetical protein ACQKGB_27230 [Bacillus tropicus]|uniref:hypothetical protein n=1 Tax=Bacillus tropicus TaxID=2026188 RepID=UPI003CFFEE22